MKVLTSEQQDMFYLKRRLYSMSFEDLATILNCTKNQIINAQLGSPVSDDVHNAVVDWIENYGGGAK